MRVRGVLCCLLCVVCFVGGGAVGITFLRLVHDCRSGERCTVKVKRE